MKEYLFMLRKNGEITIIEDGTQDCDKLLQAECEAGGVFVGTVKSEFDLPAMQNELKKATAERKKAVEDFKKEIRMELFG